MTKLTIAAKNICRAVTWKLSMKKALETLLDILTEIGWEPERNDDSSFYVDFGPPHIPVSGAIAAVTADAQFVFYINFGRAAPPERRDDVATFINRANCGLLIGNFEMDYGDGHVRFKSSFDFNGENLSAGLVRNAILSAMNAVEAYAESLIAVMIQQEDALLAIQKVEAKLSQDSNVGREMQQKIGWTWARSRKES